MLGASLLGYAASQGLLHGWNNLLEMACGLAACACVAVRRRCPKLAGLAAACCFGLSALGSNDVLPSDLFFLLLFLIAYSLRTADDAVHSRAWCIVRRYPGRT